MATNAHPRRFILRGVALVITAGLVELGITALANVMDWSGARFYALSGLVLFAVLGVGLPFTAPLGYSEADQEAVSARREERRAELGALRERPDWTWPVVVAWAVALLSVARRAGGLDELLGAPPQPPESSRRRSVAVLVGLLLFLAILTLITGEGWVVIVSTPIFILELASAIRGE